MNHNLTCKLMTKKGNMAEIDIDGQKVTIPLKYIPKNVTSGDQFQLYFLANSHLDKNLARQILEEILNGK